MSDREEQHDEGSSASSLGVVGLGASAGGLDALRRFFDTIPADSGLAFVVVVHLHPEYESHLAELLQPHTSLPVSQVTETVPLEPNRVYVIPPDANLEAIDTHLRLGPLEESRSQRAVIDHFFRTLGKRHDGHAVGVILSGTGSDGALGIRAIKESGGLTVAQDPDEAEHDGMPRSAIGTGQVDLVLSIEAMGEAIGRYVRTRPRIELDEEDEAAARVTPLLPKILTQVRARTGRDFSHYKVSTLKRRIARRMQFHELEQLEAYLALLRQNADEGRALADDLLITVTGFFRDAAVFDYLVQTVIPQLVAEHADGGELRIWSVGCATGEEAYSLAMMVLEEAARQEARPALQVFASDLHGPSLETAREGLYHGQIEQDVGTERLRRFFEKDSGGYRITGELRDRVVFAPHNVLGDPPFSRMDLISCRNLLIYLQRDLQRRVVELFHYSLRPEGALVLGTSESVEATDLFRTESKPHCIYRKRNVPPPELRLPVFPLAPNRTSGVRPEPVEPPPPPLAFDEMHRGLVMAHASPSILVNPDDRIVHFSPEPGPYFVHAGGEPTLQVFRTVREELRLELRALLASVRSRGASQRTGRLTLDLGGEERGVVLEAHPVNATVDHEGFVLVFFHGGRSSVDQSERDAAEGDDGGRLRELALQEEMTRQRLETVIDEYETSKEELKASNEELQSSNEELRSTLEELETSKEELQSMNEELQTVNQENRHKVEELAQLTNDLQNLLAATDIATLFLDRTLRILRFTPKVERLFNVRHVDRGRPLSDLTHHLGYDELSSDAERVLESLVPIEREVRDDEGRTYLVRVLPYQAAGHRIDGVVITFIDVSERVWAHEALQLSQARYQRLFESIAEGFCLVERVEGPAADAQAASYRYVEANPAFASLFGVGDVSGEPLGQTAVADDERWPALFDEVLRTGQPQRVDHAVSPNRDRAGSRMLELSVFAVDDGSDARVAMLVSDVTDRSRAMAALADSEAFHRLAVEAGGVGTWEVDLETGACHVSPRMLAFLGRAVEELPVQSAAHQTIARAEWLAAVHSEDRAAVRESLEGGLEPGVGFELEFRTRAFESDDVRWIHSKGALVPDPAGRRRIRGASIDVTDRRRAEAAVRQREAEFRAVFEAAAVGTVRLDLTTGRMLQVNETFASLVRQSAEQVISRSFFDLVHADHRDTMRVVFQRMAEGELEAHETELRLSDGEGEPCWVFFSVKVVREIGDTHAVALMFDITRRRAVEQSLEEENRRKDDYLAMLGHELRNPLAAIHGAAELVKLADVQDPRIARAHQVLERQTSHMKRLVDGLLEISRIARGKVRLVLQPLDLRAILAGVAQDRSDEATERELVLETQLPDAPVWVHADDARLTQVFDNLVANALKFTEGPGRIDLELRAVQGAAMVTVRDTGVGIRQEMLAKIFDSFRQGEQDLSRREGGLGLGLALAKRLVDLHQGTIEARSEGLGHGAELVVCLPLGEAPAESESTSESTPPSPRRILVVEDDLDTAEMLCQVLEHRGHHVVHAATAREGLEMLRERPADIVLSDLGLPDMSGYELARAIRADAELGEALLVACTGYGQRNDEVRATEAGFDAHLVKPISVEDLEETLAELVRSR